MAVFKQRVDMFGEAYGAAADAPLRGEPPLSLPVAAIDDDTAASGTRPDRAVAAADHRARRLCRLYWHQPHRVVDEVHQRQPRGRREPEVALLVGHVLLNGREELLVAVLVVLAVGIVREYTLAYLLAAVAHHAPVGDDPFASLLVGLHLPDEVAVQLSLLNDLYTVNVGRVAVVDAQVHLAILVADPGVARGQTVDVAG